jgi:sugar lactone lactonase YvrE
VTTRTYLVLPLFFACALAAQDTSQIRVRPGLLSQWAGTGDADYGGDNGPAISAGLQNPSGVAVGARGLYIADTGNNCIRLVSPSGQISTVAGTGAPAYSGDGGAATAAALNVPMAVAVDGEGNLYIADTGNDVIRRVDVQTGIITTVAGGGNGTGMGSDGLGDDGPAVGASLWQPSGIAINPIDNSIYIADSYDNLIRRVDAKTNIISIVAGTGLPDYSGDGGQAIAAQLLIPTGIAIRNNILYIADSGNDRIRAVDLASGRITTIAGGGAGTDYDSLGDGGAATAAQLHNPTGISVDAYGTIYVADTFDGLVRAISSGGTIRTVAGSLSPTSMQVLGDGSPLSTGLSAPYGVAVSDDGEFVYIADTGNLLVRRLSLAAGYLEFSGSGVQTLELFNSAATDLRILGLSIDGSNDYWADNSCSIIPARSTCEINVSFSPLTSGTKSAQLELTTDIGSSIMVSLTGFASADSTGSPKLSLSTSTVDFGQILVGNTLAKTVVIGNSGTAALTLQSVTSSSPEFQIANSCGATLAPNSQCQLTVVFSPLTVGAESAEITLATSAGSSIVSVTGLATGSPKLSLSTSTLDFGVIRVGNTLAKTVVIGNSGTAALTLQSVTSSSPEFQIANSCGATLAPNSQCQLTVVFSPLTVRALADSLLIGSAAQTTTISLIGAGKQTERYAYRISPVRAQSLAPVRVTGAANETVVSQTQIQSTTFRPNAAMGNHLPINVTALDTPVVITKPQSLLNWSAMTVPAISSPAIPLRSGADSSTDFVHPFQFAKRNMPPTSDTTVEEPYILQGDDNAQSRIVQKDTQESSVTSRTTADDPSGLDYIDISRVGFQGNTTSAPGHDRPPKDSTSVISAAINPLKITGSQGEITGWAFSDSLPISQLTLHVDNQEIPIRSVVANPNMCAALHVSDCQHVAWEASIPRDLCRPGRHRLTLRVNTANGHTKADHRVYMIDSHRHLVK